MIPTQSGKFIFLEKMGKLWRVSPSFWLWFSISLVEDTFAQPLDDSDHNLNLNNTTAVFRWCDPTGFWEWGSGTGVRKIQIALGRIRYHCWYLGKGGLDRAVVLTNDYLMVIDANYGLNHGGALKI